MLAGRLPVRLPPVAATLLGPLHARAVDAGRWLPLLGDVHARELVARLDHDFSPFTDRPRQLVAVVRTLVFDEVARAFLAAHPDGTVIELGAGLNTRFERLDNGRQRWFDLDLPEVTALRRQLLAASPRRRHAAASIPEPGWMELVARSPGPHCFLMEATIGYLPCAEVRGVLAQLARRFPGATIAFDLPPWWTVVDGELTQSPAAADVLAVDLPRAIEAWRIGLSLVETFHFLASTPRCPGPLVLSAVRARARRVPRAVLRVETEAAAPSSGAASSPRWARS
jgi:O-methyltransferase involved in polyketide biosynthesis